MNDIMKKFKEIFGAGGTIVSAFAPGRVNLIGEHTDYNGGHVFPCALTLGTYAAARRRDDGLVRIYSELYPDSGVITRRFGEAAPAGNWTDYPFGVLRVLTQRHGDMPGMDLCFTGDLMVGVGLSSSASVEMAAAVLINEMCGMNLGSADMARACQEAENSYVGVNCGVMDQFASAAGRAGHGMYLDTMTLECDHVPFDSESYAIVVTDSAKRRTLVGSAYNDRRRECERALSDIGSAVSAQGLCKIIPELFEEHKKLISDPVCRRRAKHAVYEEKRTSEAREALLSGDYVRFGGLMIASHVSLRDDFEVSCMELDALVDCAMAQPGVLGSRMTGAGFGGCTVTVLERAALGAFLENTGELYRERTGLRASFYPVIPGDGAKVL